MNVQQIKVTPNTKVQRASKIKLAVKKIQLSANDLKAIEIAEKLFEENKSISYEELYSTIVKNSL